VKLLLFGTFLVSVCLTGVVPAQTNPATGDFSITLKREGCLGDCPDYEVSISRDGSIRYKGRAYVRFKGLRSRKVKPSEVQKLVARLREEDFFRWKENEMICVDYPVVHIIAKLEGKQKHVFEGCETPGKILDLADEIDRVAGTSRWVSAK
jgi:hypothetical protein